MAQDEAEKRGEETTQPPSIELSHVEAALFANDKRFGLEPGQFSYTANIGLAGLNLMASVKTARSTTGMALPGRVEKGESNTHLAILELNKEEQTIITLPGGNEEARKDIITISRNARGIYHMSINTLPPRDLSYPCTIGRNPDASILPGYPEVNAIQIPTTSGEMSRTQLGIACVVDKSGRAVIIIDNFGVNPVSISAPTAMKSKGK